MPVKDLVYAKNLTENWQIGLFNTACYNPKTCLYSCFCPSCKAYSQRKELLELTREPYVFAGGMCASSCCCGCNKPCNQMWLCCEAICCVPFAISGNRFIIQTRFNRRNTMFDTFIIMLTAITACFAQCYTLFSGGRKIEGCEHVAETLVCSVQGCMLTQQDTEIKYLKTFGYNGAPSYIANLLAPEVVTAISLKAPDQQEMESSKGKPVLNEKEMKSAKKEKSEKALVEKS